MGNCQAVDSAALVIQHPNGKVERMYWPIIANQVMKMNPGFHVSLIIPLEPASATCDRKNANTGRYTRVKLLRPTDTLLPGRAYRLVTAQEVKKVLRAKRMAKTKMNEMGLGLGDEKLEMSQREEREREREGEKLNSEKSDQVSSKPEKPKLKSGSMNLRSKTWQPSLLSISEAGG